MSEERKRPRIRRSSVNRDEERKNEKVSYQSREGGEDAGNHFQHRSFGNRPRREQGYSYIRDLSKEREQLAKGEYPGNFDYNDSEQREKRGYAPRGNYRGRDAEERGERKFDRGERGFGRGERRFEVGNRRAERAGQGERDGRNTDRGRDERRNFKDGNRFERSEKRGAEQGRRFEQGEGRKRNVSRPDGGDGRKSVYSKKKQLEHKLKNEDKEEELRLNRYIAKGGVCSRRDADALIQEGRVKVNGEVVLQVGTKVKRTDKVEVDDVEIVPEKKVYIVLNKPKDYVTTMDDPLERKTVMSLIEGACKERVYPVGRLDRQTTGVLLFTNDGDFAKKLTHPKYNQKKIYHVFLDKAMKISDMEAILKGVELEDGFVKADDLRISEEDNKQVGIEIHSGKNRIVRRIFEHFGYQIEKLDRVFFAGITKKNLPRGHWRFLTKEEINTLKSY